MTLALYGKSRKRQGTLVLGALLAIVLAFVVAMSLAGSALAATTASLTPAGQGSYTQWYGTESDIDETAGTCASDSNYIHDYWSGNGSRESVNLDESSIPDGSTITSVTVTVCHSASTEGNGGTFQTFARLAGTNYDSGADIAAGSSRTSTAQAIAIPSVVKVSDASLDLEIGVVSTSNRAKRVYRISAVVTYTPVVDDDGDGVPNNVDDCAGTPNPPVGGLLANGCDWQQEINRTIGVVKNPDRPTECGTNFSIVLDKTGSFSATEREDTEDAAKQFVTDILTVDPTASFSVASFANGIGQGPHITNSITAASIHTAIDDNGGTGGSTNWSAGMAAGNVAGTEWMLVFTDGNPNEPGGPGSNDVDYDSVAAAVNTANIIKGGPTHITVIGINTTGNAPAGFGPDAQLYASWVAPGDVQVGNISDLAAILESIRTDCAPDPKEFTVNASKVVCDTEADLPNWGTGANGAPGVIGATTASDYVAASKGACHLDPNWVFEINRVAGADHPRPDNNILHAADYTSFVGSTTIPATGQYRIREQKPAGYVDFSGTTSSPQDDVSAEFYCGDDIQNYDNLEWVGGANAYCVGFNARTTINLTLVKSDENGAVPGNFDLEIRSWPADALIQSGTGTGTTAAVAPGNDYHIVELDEPGWVLAGVQCQDSQQNNVPLLPNNDANSRVVQIPANVAGDVTCTFTNRPTTATIHVDKVVCAGGTFPQAFARPIATDTASNFASSVAACDLASGWEFEYKNDGNWHAFSNPTDGNGRTSEEVVVKQGQTVEIRETLQGAYNLAQLSCHNDTGGEIDNLDWVQNVSPGGEYYCIAINTPKEVKVNFVKAICPTYGDVPRNYTGGTAHPGLPVDQLGPASPADGSAVDLGDIPDACEVQPDNTWTFDLGSAINSSDLGQVQNGYVTLTGAQALQALTGKLWVSEVEQPNYLFASLKCYKDHVNQDNDDYIQLNNEIPKDVYCIAYNVPAKGKIWNVKVVTNDGADDTLFTADITGTENFPGRTFGQGNPDSVDALVGYYSSVEQDPSPEYTWMSTVAYDGSQLSWDDGEPICPVDYKVARDDLVVEVLGHELKPGGDLVFCHYNERLGQVFLTKYENIGGADTWDFDADELGDPSYAMPSNTTGITISHTESWWLSEGNYSVSELNPGGICEEIPGAVTGDFETLVKVANAPIGANEVTDLGSSTNYSVTPGGKTYIAFGNRDCSEVLSAANIIVRKWQDVDADFSGESLLSGWTITITGTGGAAAGFGPVSQDTAAGVAAFLGVPDGTYTIQETPKVTHTVVGSDWRVGGLPNGSNTSGGATLAGVSVALNEELNVDFFNQPKGKITVVKVETDNVGGGNFTWDFALDGCGIHKELSIVGSGSGSFQNLLPCANYLVTETNANSNGFFSTPIGGQGVNLGPGGEETVTFSNVRNPDSTPPPPTTTVTPPTSTPTHTPTVSTTPTDPTDTPVDPTDTPTPESTVAGEKTPGPGNLATPIAPDSGSGLAGSSTGASIMLLLMGLAAITIGSGFLALGRKRS